MGYIYKITNTVTSKCYIGVTIQQNYEARWRKHRNCLNYKEGCPLLKASMKKHGLDKFTFKIILICFDEDLLKYEREYIKKYNSQVPNGYNILPGGQLGDGMLGYKHTPETIEKIKESGKRFREANPHHFETYREKHIDAIKKIDISDRVKNSENFKKAVAEGRIGGADRKINGLSKSTKQKISESLKNYYKDNIFDRGEGVRNALSKAIAQYAINGDFIREYKSAAEAGRITTVKQSNIRNALSNKAKTAGGFLWKFIPKQVPSPKGE